MLNRKNAAWALTAAATLASGNAMAAGFEKSTMFSGKYAPMGGAAAGMVEGGESLYFNPAGLANGAGNGDISLNFSPSFSSFSGPVTSTTVLESDNAMSPIFGAFASYKFLDGKLGVGAGANVAAGSGVTMKDVVFDLPVGDDVVTDLSTKLVMLEYSLGAAYEVIDGLRIGASARLVNMSADMKSASAIPAASPVLGGLAVTNMTNLTDSQVSYRAGVQYAPKGGSWGVGASVRTSTAFDAAGEYTQDLNLIITPGTRATQQRTGAATLGASLPLSASLGGYYDVMAGLRVAFEYNMTQYSELATLDITLTPEGSSASTSARNLNWDDQTTLRLGAQYDLNDSLAIRGGYVYTSQVTNSNFASGASIAPGVGHTVLLGLGTSFMDKKLGVNVAGEYTTTSGNGQTEAGIAGDFATTFYSAHVGISYAL